MDLSLAIEKKKSSINHSCCGFWLKSRVSDRNSHAPRLHCSARCVPNVLTGAGHGGRVRLGAKVSLVAHAGGGALPDGVAVQRTLGAGAIGGQGAVVADLTGWREGEKRDKGRAG